MNEFLLARVAWLWMPLMLLAGSNVRADTATEKVSEISPWSLTGYGTLGFSKVMGDVPYYFIRELNQGVEGHRVSSWLPDSRVGVQLAYKASPSTDVVAQAVLRDKTQSTLNNSIEWAYVSHRVTEDFTLRVGRVGLDAFLLSDYRSLGYAQTMVRPSTDFYGFHPFYTVEGIDASYKISRDAVHWQFKSQLGQTQTDVPVTGGLNFHTRVKDFRDVSVSRESGPWRLKAGFIAMQLGQELPLADLTTPLQALAATGVPGVANEAAALAKGLQFMDARVNYVNMGASYDDGIWSAQAELSRVSADRQAMISGLAAYLSVGRRFGVFMPYACISSFRPDQAQSTAINDWASILGNPAAGQLQAAAVQASNSARIDQNTVSLGLRWDFHPQTAFKIQWDRFDINPNGFGLWRAGAKATMASERINLLTTSVDWIF